MRPVATAASTVLLLVLCALAAASPAAAVAPETTSNPLGFSRPGGDNGRDLVVYRATDGWDRGSRLVFDEVTLAQAEYRYRTRNGVLHRNLTFRQAKNFCTSGADRRTGWRPEKSICKARVRDNLRSVVGQLDRALNASAGNCVSAKSPTRRLLVRPIEHRLRIVRATAGFGLFFGSTFLANTLDSNAAKAATVASAVALGSLINDYLDVEAQRAVETGVLIALNQAYEVGVDLVAALRRMGSATAAVCNEAVRVMRAGGNAAGRQEVPLGA